MSRNARTRSLCAFQFLRVQGEVKTRTPSKTEGVRHPKIPFVPSTDVRCEVERVTHPPPGRDHLRLREQSLCRTRAGHGCAVQTALRNSGQRTSASSPSANGSIRSAKRRKRRVSYGFESISRGKIEPTARQNPHPLQKRKTQRVRHPQIPSVPSVDVRCLVEGSATRPSTELEGCATRQRKKKKTPSKLWVRINLKGEDRADRASKPAPFAEKKNAKSAAPANSIGAFG